MYLRLHVVALCLVSLSPSLAISGAILNGDFSNGLGSWLAQGPVLESNGAALFEDDLVSFQASLSQQFMIPAGAMSLSFDYSLLTTPGGIIGGLGDFFTVSLLDGASNPILSTPGFSDVFYADATGLIDFDPTIVDLSASLVTLDVSGVAANTQATLIFDLFVGDDGLVTSVSVDNVHLDGASPQPIPEPTSVAVWSAFLGLIAAGHFRRRRSIHRAKH